VKQLAVPLLAIVALAGCGAQSGTSATAMPTATPSSSGIAGCVPECIHGGTDPGTLAAGPYTTQYFLAGHLTVTFAATWESHHDHTQEFSAAPSGLWDTHRVLFWSDILPIGPDGKQVAGVSRTTAGMLEWFAARPNLLVSNRHPASIGAGHLSATVIDMTVASHAVNEDPNCPSAACVVFLTWPNAPGMYAIGGPGVFRLYLSDITYGGQRHLLAVGIESKNPADFAAWLPTAEALIATARAPVSPA
jgi:hypothetical protein